MSTYLYMMGWNEILARVFSGFKIQRSVSPDWLINPATRRKLKLDVLYPDIGIAIRFVGLQAKGIGRKSDWEELEDSSRDETRKELCRLNGVDLILITPYDAQPDIQLRQISMALGSASRNIAKSGRFNRKANLLEQLSAARKELETIRPQIKKLDDLTPYAELWRDRETRQLNEIHTPQSRSKGNSRARFNIRKLREGTEVKHERFGGGVITKMEERDEDIYLTISFFTEGERQFAASLAADKLTMIR